MNKSIAVFGLGRFGRSLATELYNSGVDVMVVDKNEYLVNEFSGKSSYAVIADLTNEESIKDIGIENMDVVVVTMGSDLTASIMSVMVAKEVGVPYVIAKAADVRMGNILTKMGADKVIYPEEEMGIRTAQTIVSDDFLDYFNIDNNLCILEMKTKPEWVGKNLIDLDLRNKYHINVVAIKYHSKMHSSIDPNRPLEADSRLVVIIEKSQLAKIRRDK
ncbi:MAG: TrkA family potassium uptake protein [Lachnospiraceae bacterium]|nr:TrkA family potassium uptake protein [Lachnospiraceae bacterium]